MKKIAKILPFIILLMSFQCNDEHYEKVHPKPTIKVSENTVLKINDTIWIRGFVSSKLYDTQINDSVFYSNPYIESLSLMKLVTPNDLRNSVGAVKRFKLVNQIGTLNASSCKESSLSIKTVLNKDRFYEYKIGIIPLNKGDFFISSSMGKIINLNKNTNILNNYTTPNNNNFINFERCGVYNSRLTSESESEYFFKVE